MGVLVSAGVVAPGAGAVTWSSPPQDVSILDQDAKQISVANAAEGTGLMAFVQNSAITNVDTVFLAVRKPGQNFEAPVPISQTATDASDAKVVMNRRGDAIITWMRVRPGSGSPGSTEISYRMRPAGGPLDPERTDAVSLGGPSAFNAHVALDNNGNAIAAFERAATVSFPNRVQGTYRPAGTNSPWGGSETLSEPGVLLSQNPEIAMDGQGNAVVAFEGLYDAQPTPEKRVQAAFGPYNGNGNGGFYEPKTLKHAADGFSDPYPAFDTSGNAMVVWSRYTNDSGGSWSVEEATRPASPLPQNPEWSGFRTIGSPRTPSVRRPRIAFDPSGNAIATWYERTSPDFTEPHTGRIASAVRPAGSTVWGTPVGVSTSDVIADDSAAPFGIDDRGRAVTVWRATTGGDDLIQGATREAGGGTAFGPVTTISVPGELTPEGQELPGLAVAGNGQAIASWGRLGDTNFLAQAAFGTPPGDPAPPPPPPAPQPPVPNAIQPAAPFEKGKAIVLTAKVSGDVTRVEWDFSGGGPNVVGQKVNGVLQSSVRLRPSQRSFKATVKAFGPGGSNTHSRSFTLPKPSADSATQTVEASISAAAPGVFAVGDPQALLGRAGKCGPMTIFSSKQTIKGCMKPIDSLGDVPSRELGVLEPLAENLKLDPTDASVMQAAMKRLDGYISNGQTQLNSYWPVQPEGAADVLSFAQAKLLTSSNAFVEVAGVKFGASSKGFSLDLDPSKLDIPLGDLPKPPKLPSIGGFELVGDWNIDLKSQQAIIKASLKLPKFITSAGVSIQNSVTLRATKTELLIDEVSVGPIKADIGGLGIDGFKIAYEKPTDLWLGQGKICLLTKVCIDMTPPNGQVKVQRQRLVFAGATVPFPPPGIPLFTGVNLERIGFGLGLDPTRFVGNGRIAVLKLAKLDGRLVAAFPSSRAPFVLRADEVGGGFPANLYGTQFTRPTLGATAGVEVNIPVVGDLALGNGYFLYAYPNYIALGGSVGVKLLDVISLNGGVSGEANLRDEVANLHGNINACLHIIRSICGGAVANVSRGPNNAGGAGACIQLGPVSVGGGIHWNDPTDPSIWPFDGCKWSPFRLDVSKSQAGGARTITVKRGESPAIKMYGEGAAPRVHVTGPGGQVLDSTDNGLDTSPGGKIRILRFEGAVNKFTVVGLQNATPGTYTVTPLPDSAAVSRVTRTMDPPDAKISGKVSGKGARRVLSYKVRKRPGQAVIFQEIDAGGTSKQIGRIGNRSSGKIRFSPAPGKGRRRIQAQIELDGIPAERKTIASFRPPTASLKAPRGIKVKRGKKSIAVTWKRVIGAKRYEVAATSRTGYQKVIKTKTRRVVIKRVPRTAGGRVTVRAVDTLRQSAPVGKKFKRVAAPKRLFQRLGKCKRVSKKKINCGKRAKPKRKSRRK